MENQENLKQEELIEEETEKQEEKKDEQNEITDEQKEKEEQMKKERAFFDLEKGIEFQEVIKEEDAIQFNFYLQNNVSNFTRKVFSALLGLFLIGYVIYIKSYYAFIAVGVLIVIYSIFLYTPIQKAKTRRMFKKRTFNDLVINMKFGETKIKYELETETISPLVEYAIIQRVVKTNDYIYLHIGPYQVIIVKLEGLECKEELISFIKEKFEPLNKYKEK